jgi:hypothetical protein
MLHRCFAWDRRAKPTEPGGPLWVPRTLQGDGRHDNPEHYGCLYVAAPAAGAVVEQLARFRGNVLVPAMLKRRGRGSSASIRTWASGGRSTSFAPVGPRS